MPVPIDRSECPLCILCLEAETGYNIVVMTNLGTMVVLSMKGELQKVSDSIRESLILVANPSGR